MSFEESVGENFRCLQLTFSRNTDIEETTSEVTEGSEEHAIGNNRKWGAGVWLHSSGEPDNSVVVT